VLVNIVLINQAFYRESLQQIFRKLVNNILGLVSLLDAFK